MELLSFNQDTNIILYIYQENPETDPGKREGLRNRV
jgi:hypothetical protein